MATDRVRLGSLRYYVAGSLPGGRPARCFVIYGLGRTGSELLVSLLDSHPEVRCEGELLERPIRGAAGYLRGRAWFAARRGASAYGVKLLAHQAGNRRGEIGVLQDLRSHGWQVVHLCRRNRLRHALSFIDAQRGQPHVTVDTVNRFEPIVVDPPYLVASIVGLEAAEKTIATHLEPADIEIVYEADLTTSERQRDTAARLFDWLGVSKAQASTRFVRRSPTALCQAIANYDEVAHLVHETRFAAMLDDE